MKHRNNRLKAFLRRACACVLILSCLSPCLLTASEADDDLYKANRDARLVLRAMLDITDIAAARRPGEDYNTDPASEERIRRAMEPVLRDADLPRLELAVSVAEMLQRVGEEGQCVRYQDDLFDYAAGLAIRELTARPEDAAWWTLFRLKSSFGMDGGASLLYNEYFRAQAATAGRPVDGENYLSPPPRREENPEPRLPGKAVRINAGKYQSINPTP